MADSSEKNAQQFFDDLAAGWTQRYATVPAMAARLQRFERALAGVAPGSHILDFGCGSGMIARHLARLGYRVHGTDISPEMIEAARSEGDEDIEWSICPESGQLPASNGSFDVIISSSVLEYVPTPQVLLGEFRRLLKPNGLLAVTVPDERDNARRKEAVYRTILALPGIKALLARSRWAEGAAYLSLSHNHLSPQRWLRLLVEAGFAPTPAPACQGPLLMLTGRAA